MLFFQFWFVSAVPFNSITMCPTFGKAMPLPYISDLLPCHMCHIFRTAAAPKTRAAATRIPAAAAKTTAAASRTPAAAPTTRAAVTMTPAAGVRTPAAVATILAAASTTVLCAVVNLVAGRARGARHRASTAARPLAGNAFGTSLAPSNILVRVLSNKEPKVLVHQGRYGRSFAFRPVMRPHSWGFVF